MPSRLESRGVVPWPADCLQLSVLASSLPRARSHHPQHPRWPNAATFPSSYCPQSSRRMASLRSPIRSRTSMPCSPARLLMQPASLTDVRRKRCCFGRQRAGAYGAGYLRGWGERRGGLPDFDLVTGVSAGSILSTAAFIGDYRGSSQRVFERYRRTAGPRPLRQAELGR